MSDTPDTADAAQGDTPSERIPMMQRLLDNPFALLFIGVTVPTVFYLVWGLIELTHIPIAP